MQRTVFFISDGTAITTEKLGHSLLTQFPDVEFRQVRIPFASTEKLVADAVDQINAAFETDGAPPLVFNSIVNPSLTENLMNSSGIILDLFSAFLEPMAQALGVEPKRRVGKAHGMTDRDRYEDRMEATNYALTHDDGMSLTYTSAELILVGVSRSGKTPTCLYIGLHFGIKSANYPLTESDLEAQRLPQFLRVHKSRIVGLLIDPDRLAQIRETRRPGSKYASLKQTHWEIESAESLLRAEGIPTLYTTHASVEEIASRVLMKLDLQRDMF
ncbi:MAG TPA: pyruvate, water dikinase regulatory protein [Xanthomonadales bacterium]|nr:pyruvate, water dikinase regulatory protein [Xanthomonadales bacterium]